MSISPSEYTPSEGAAEIQRIQADAFAWLRKLRTVGLGVAGYASWEEAVGAAVDLAAGKIAEVDRKTVTKPWVGPGR